MIEQALTLEEIGQMLRHIEERVERLESIVTGPEWRQAQARLNDKLWQEIQDVKRMISSTVRVPTERN